MWALLLLFCDVTFTASQYHKKDTQFFKQSSSDFSLSSFCAFRFDASEENYRCLEILKICWKFTRKQIHLSTFQYIQYACKKCRYCQLAKPITLMLLSTNCRHFHFQPFRSEFHKSNGHKILGIQHSLTGLQALAQCAIEIQVSCLAYIQAHSIISYFILSKINIDFLCYCFL